MLTPVHIAKQPVEPCRLAAVAVSTCQMECNAACDNTAWPVVYPRYCTCTWASWLTLGQYAGCDQASARVRAVT